MEVRFTRYAGKYISSHPSQGEPHGNMVPHKWQDANNILYERHCINVAGIKGVVDSDVLSGTHFGMTTEPDKHGKKYVFPVNKKCYEIIN